MRRCYYVPILFSFFLVLVVVVWMFSQKYPKEYFQPEDNPWYEKTTEQFYQRFGRPVDPVHLIYYDFETRSKSNKKSLDWITTDLNEYENQVRNGLVRTSQSSIVIAGLIRNGAFHINKLKERCERIASFFKEYKIVILENNSTDGTREFLLQWAQEDQNVTILCKDSFAVNLKECDITYLFPKSENLGGSPLPARIQKMAFLRNVYLQHVKHYYSKYDYFCVMDMDLNGDMYSDGFLQTVHLLNQNKNIDAIACNGLLLRTDSDQYYYYDSFAHIEKTDSYIFENQTSKNNHDQYVHSLITLRYTTSMKIDTVRSAFGGIVLYKMNKIQDAFYDFSPNFLSCEHSFFHKKISMAVNPRFIFLISQNGA